MKKRNKKHTQIDAFKATRIFDMQRDFAEIEKFFRVLRADNLDIVKDTEKNKWVLSQKNQEGEWYDLLGSIDSWLEFFRRLAEETGMNDIKKYDDSAIKKLISKLRLDQPVNHDLIDQAEKILKPQRYLFMTVSANLYNSTRNEVFDLVEKRRAA